MRLDKRRRLAVVFTGLVFFIGAFASMVSCSSTLSSSATGLTGGSLCGDLPAVDYDSELLIRAISVVEDPLRSQWSGQLDPPDDQDGAWSFGRLFADIARIPDANGLASDHCIMQGKGQCLSSYTPVPAATFVRNWLETWDQDQDINCDSVPARPAIEGVISSWPTLPNGDLDLTKAPFRLLAIVRRPDLVDMSPPGTNTNDCTTFVRTPRSAGQLRFVFNLLDASGTPQDFMVIFEYNVPADTLAAADVELNRWHSLASDAVGTPAYLSRLATLTRDITRDGGRYSWPYKVGDAVCNDAGRAHDNNLVAIRTQDRVLASPSQFREFLIGLESKSDAPQPFYLSMSPQYQYRQTERLGDFIAQNCGAIEQEHFKVGQEFPQWDGGGDGATCANPDFANAQFQAGQLPNEQVQNERWDPGNDDASTICNGASVANSDLRHLFARNTCNGCHGIEFEMQAHGGAPAEPFHIQPRAAGHESDVSRFLQGSYSYVDPLGVARTIDERAIRINAYTSGICNAN